MGSQQPSNVKYNVGVLQPRSCCRLSVSQKGRAWITYAASSTQGNSTRGFAPKWLSSQDRNPPGAAPLSICGCKLKRTLLVSCSALQHKAPNVLSCGQRRKHCLETKKNKERHPTTLGCLETGKWDVKLHKSKRKSRARVETRALYIHPRRMTIQSENENINVVPK